MKYAPQPNKHEKKFRPQPKIPEHLSAAPDLPLDAPDLVSFEKEMEKRVNKASVKPTVVELRKIENPSVQ